MAYKNYDDFERWEKFQRDMQESYESDNDDSDYDIAGSDGNYRIYDPNGFLIKQGIKSYEDAIDAIVKLRGRNSIENIPTRGIGRNMQWRAYNKNGVFLGEVVTDEFSQDEANKIAAIKFGADVYRVSLEQI